MDSVKVKHRGSGSEGERSTIGYLALRTGDNVSQAIWLGVVDGARERGANLLCFAGDRLRDPAGGSLLANVLYDLVNPEVVDGLVTWASSVGGSLARDEIVQSMVSITLPMEGHPTVLIDSYTGMRNVIAHLVEFHGRRHLAFIHGPASHYYAQERYRAYVDALEAYGISLDPNLVTGHGDFVPSTGAEGIGPARVHVGRPG